jgi:uncharacterized protein YbaR (Trm112 family)
MIDLGYANSWQVAPDIVKICRTRRFLNGEKDRGHEIERTKISRCVEEISCKICGYRYKIDSGVPASANGIIK